MELDPRWFTFFTAVGAAIVAWGQWRSKKALDLRTASFQYSLTKNKDYLEARSKVDEWFRAHEGMDELAAEYAVDSEKKNPFRQYEGHNFKGIEQNARYLLAHWEIMAISIVNECVDERVCFEMVGTTLLSTVRRLRPFIDDLRNKDSDCRRYDYVLILADSWTQRMEAAKKKEPNAKTPIEFVILAAGNSARRRMDSIAALFRPIEHLDEKLSRYNEYLNSGSSIERMRRKLFKIWDSW